MRSKKDHPYLTSEDILGKNVIDAEGTIIGVAEKVYLDPKSLDFVAISVDKGLVKQGLTVGKDYIDRVTPYAVLLKVRPLLEIRGMAVYDCDGVHLGVVHEVRLKGRKNRIDEIVVRRRLADLVIDAGQVDRIAQSVFLKVSKLETENAGVDLKA